MHHHQGHPQQQHHRRVGQRCRHRQLGLVGASQAVAAQPLHHLHRCCHHHRHQHHHHDHDARRPRARQACVGGVTTHRSRRGCGCYRLLVLLPCLHHHHHHHHPLQQLLMMLLVRCSHHRDH